MSQGYGRKGAALHGLGRLDAAIAAYEKGLDVEPGLAMLTKGLDDAKREADKAGGAGGMNALGGVFGAPDVISKIASNPQTAGFLADPSFMMKIQELQRDPNAISKHMSDPRILNVMGMLMGVNIQTPDSMGGDFGGGPSSSAPTPPPKKPEPEPEPEVRHLWHHMYSALRQSYHAGNHRACTRSWSAPGGPRCRISLQ